MIFLNFLIPQMKSIIKFLHLIFNFIALNPAFLIQMLIKHEIILFLNYLFIFHQIIMNANLIKIY